MKRFARFGSAICMTALLMSLFGGVKAVRADEEALVTLDTWRVDVLVDMGAAGTAAYGSSTVAAKFIKTIGEEAFGLMLPILAGYIAMSIADRPGLAPGFVAGVFAKAGYSLGFVQASVAGDAEAAAAACVSGGFIAALFAGFAAGYFMRWFEKVCEKLPKSDRILRLEIDFGEGQLRQICSGIAEFCKPEELVGRQVCAVLNLAPRKIRGAVSNGMVLTAEKDGKLCLLEPASPMPDGSRIG